MNIVFMGSPEFAVVSLNKIAALSFVNISGVFTQPDKPKGRGMQMLETEVAVCAKQHNIPVYKQKSLRNDESLDILKTLNPDLIIVAAYGLILPKSVLDLPKYGVINIHGSILPRWRGAAPIHHAILSGDEYTGITIMQMDEGLDTGDMISISKNIPITHETTFKILHDDLAEIGADMAVDTVTNIYKTASKPAAVKQDSALATYANKITKQDLPIKFNTTSELCLRQIRALSEFGAYITLNGENIKILDAEIINNTGAPGEILDKNLSIATQNSAIKPLMLQRPGKNPVSLKDFLNGYKNINIGEII